MILKSDIIKISKICLLFISCEKENVGKTWACVGEQREWDRKS